MGNSIGFDNEKYLRLQSEKIRERIQQFGGKLYLEFGGKLFDDYHASRVLPGFKPDSKVNMLLQLKDQAEILLVISAPDIEKNKVRGDLGITYGADVLRLIDAFRGIGLYVGSVVLTPVWRPARRRGLPKPPGGPGRKGVPALHHLRLPLQYPPDRKRRRLWKNEYVETTRSLVVVTAPGPGSGKMATCLSQLYTRTSGASRPGTPSLRPSPFGTCP